MEHRTPEIKGALWWLERRAKGFARWIEHSGGYCQIELVTDRMVQ